MKLRSRRTGSLAGDIVRITLMIGMVTIAATLIASLVGSYRLAAAQAAERQLAYLRVMQTRIEGHLGTASRTANRAVAALESTESPPPGRVLAGEYLGSIATVDRLALLTPAAQIVSAYPAWSGELPADDPELREAVQDGLSGFLYDHGDGSHPPQLWAMRPVALPSGETQMLVVRMRESLLSALADDAASREEARAVAIVEEDTLIRSGAGGPILRLANARYDEMDEGGTGAVRLTAPAVGTMRGYYLPLEGFPGLAWRIMVVEPAGATFRSSVRAVAPVVFVLIVGGLIAVVFAWGVAQRLVRPLRQVEAASLDAAAGAYVPPLRAERNDEVGRLADAFNVLALRLNALHDVARLLSSASQTDQVLDAIIESVGHLVGPGTVALYLRDAPGRFRLTRMSIPGLHAEYAHPTYAQVRLFERAVQSGAQIVPEATEIAGIVASGSEGTARMLVAPLITGEERLGVVLIEQAGPRRYTEAELEMMRTFTAQAAVALLNSRLFEEESASRETAEALRRVAEELVRPVDLAAALDAALQEVSRLLEGRTVLLAIRDRAALGLAQDVDHVREGVVLELAQRVTNGRPGRGEVARGFDTITDALLDRLTSRSVFVEEIAVANPYGAVLAVLDWDTDVHASDRQLIDGVAQVFDLALENAYFVERDRSRARNLETIFRISQAVGSSLEIRVVLNRVLDVVQMIFAADAVSLMTYDESRRTISTAMARGTISETILHYEAVPGADLPGRVFASGRPICIEEASARHSPFEQAATELGLRSVLAVPLLARGRSVGVLTVFSANAAAFDQEDMGLLQTFASQASLAIDTARLYGEEREVAEILQSSILPDQLPDFPEVDAASAYEPAGGQAEIGGDYHDLFRAPDGRVVVAMADVCGKGVEAATKTSMIKYSIRALVAAGLGPDECLAQVNDLVTRSGQPGDIVTAIVAFLDREGQTLRWANGGHPPGLLLRAADRQLLRLETTGPLLGALEGAVFERAELTILPGDTVLLYTDGVTESRNGNRFFGEGRVRRVLKYGGSAKVVTDRLVDTLHRFAPGYLRDDVAVLTVRVR